MERFKRTFSFRKKKSSVPESSKPHQWQEDEKKVRDGTCSFQVRYLGCIEVFESRGIQVCEEAVKALKSRQHRSVWSRMSVRRKKSNNKEQQAKGKYQRAVLYVSGDALRVVDEISKGLIVDQTIEKVSFCAPDRNHEKGFAYICRDGTTRRWMCHGFLAVKESGERMSHAVGCAFAICLEKKQKREKDTVSVTFNDKGTSFTRMGSFRQATLTERMVDPQSTIIPEPLETMSGASNDIGGGAVNQASTSTQPESAVERPRASTDMLNRQASFRGFTKLSDNSPFKRQLSLRLNELPSNLARQQQLQQIGHSFDTAGGVSTVSRVEAIPEVSPSKEQADISDMCNQIQGLSATLGHDDASPFSQASAVQRSPYNSPQHTVQVHPHGHTQPVATVNTQQQPQAANIPNTSAQPIRQTNPWETPPAFRHASPAESWLQSTATVLSSAPPTTNTASNGAVARTVAMSNHTTTINTAQGVAVSQRVVPTQSNVYAHPVGGVAVTPPAVAPRAPPLSLSQRSHTVDNSQIQWYHQQKAPTLKELQQTNHMNFVSQQNGTVTSAPTQPTPARPWSAQPLGPTSSDPFDAAWATKSPNVKPPSLNPFQSGDAVTQTFKVQL